MTMVSSHLGERSIRDICARTGSDRPSLSLKMTKFIAVFLMAFVAVGLQAQQQTPGSYPDGTQNINPGMQNPNTVDCADPMEIGAPECSAQAPGTGQIQNPQSRLPQSGQYDAQRRNRNYTDTEQLNRQPSQNAQIQEPRLPPEPLTEFQKFVAS